MNRTDRILDLIAAGLQSTTEASYGTDRGAGVCARCQINVLIWRRDDPNKGGDLCPGCRAFLLGDSEDDPARPTDQAAAYFAGVRAPLARGRSRYVCL